ncbi:tape measure protein [uncultured Lentilactobacillus sp.]|uniref:tape measure protein n=1 Tax=uncultured Lentilactobacillus sp. TaxID=2805375 RepID=UPI00259AADA7|nr:tape measure protein [uncultured Lentilactobacillus sp.]
MAESMSIEAVLSAVDQNFTKTMEQAVQSLGEVIDKSHQTASAGATGAGGVKQLASSLGLVAIGAKAFDVMSASVGKAVERFDTLNKFPVVMQALGYSAKDTAKSTAILKKGVDGLPTTLQDVTSVAQQLAPLTGSASKASKSAIALNNAFLASGASGADASRGLEQYTQMLSTGKVDMMSWRTLMETMPTSLRKVANSFGFTGKSAEQDLYKALQSGQITMDQLNDRFIKLNKGQNGFAALAKKNSAGIMTSFTNLKNAVANNMEGMLERINQGFSKAGLGSIAQQLDNLKYGINGAFKAIGPAVTTATTVILNFAKVIHAALGNNLFKGITVGVLSFIAAFAGISKIVSIVGSLRSAATAITLIVKAGNGVMAVKEAFDELSKSSKAVAGIKSLFTTLTANPWIAVAAAIVAVVAALTYFFTQTKTGRAAWSAFTSWLSGVWQGLVGIATTVWKAIGHAITAVVNGVKAGWQGLTSFLSGLWQGIVDIASGIWNGLVAIFTTIVSLVETVWTGLSTFFTTLWTGIVTIASTVWNAIVAVVTTVVTAIETAWSGFTTFIAAIWNGIVDTASSIWNAVASVILSVWSTITGIVSGAIGVVKSVISGGFNVARSIIANVMSAMSAVISNVWGTIKGLFNAGVAFIRSVVHVDLSGAGRAIMHSLYEGMMAVWSTIKGFVSHIAGWIKDHKGPISLDRRLLIPAGNAIMQGLNAGLTDGFKTVQSTVTAMTNAIAESANVAGFADTVQALNSMSGMKLNADGTLSSTQTINNVTSRTFEARMTEMVATAIDKLDNVDQHPIVTPVTMNQMHQYTNKLDAQSYVMWRGE